MTDRPHPARLAAAAVLCVLPVLAAAPAHAAPVAVNLRVEGATQTIYEANVTTDGHDVTTQSGGTHKCDGTNGGAHPSRVPVGTAALDDAARLGGFTWDGDWFQGFEDFLVKRVGPESNTSSQFWGFFVNGKAPDTGGCQTRVNQGDDVLWSFDAFNKQYVLRLRGPAEARTGEDVTVLVSDTKDNQPISGATVGGTTTGPDGVARLRFDQPGIYRLKADRSDSVRSRAIVLCIDPAGAPACTSGDKSAPGLQLLSLPGRYASEQGVSRTILVSWQGTDNSDGSGVASYDVDVRQAGAGVVQPAQSDWRRLVTRTAIPRRHYRGDPGASYQFKIAAADRAGNRAEATTGTITIPIDDRDRRFLRFSRGDWRQLQLKGAWGGFVARSRRIGAATRLRFNGTRVALIGRRLPNGGRLKVTVDRRSRTLRLRGTPRFRELLFRSRRLAPGPHFLRAEAIGGGPVEIDAVAPLP
jgi:hypothetical protein